MPICWVNMVNATLPRYTLRFLTSIGRRNRSYVNFLTLSITCISFLTCCNQTFLTTDRSTDAFSVYFVTYLYPYTSLRQQYHQWKKQTISAVGIVPKSNRTNRRNRGNIDSPIRIYMSAHCHDLVKALQ